MSLQHLLEGKELNRANFFVIDPRMTRTAAHATEYVRLRNGTDIPMIYGMLWHIFKNGWEDKQFIEQRVYGMDDIRKEAEKWKPEEVERVSGVPGAQLKRVAETFAKRSPRASDLGMGQPSTRLARPTCALAASCCWPPAMSAVRQRRQHLPRPHQRSGRHRSRRRRRHAAALLRAGRRRLAALEPRLGSRLRLAAVALRRSRRR